MRFKDKVYIVTGTHQGIGLAVAERLLAEGACVGMLDIAEQAPPVGPERALIVRVDVSDSAALTQAINDVATHFGHLDGLVNNAGINGPRIPIEEYPEDTFDQIVAVNFKALWIAIRATIPHLHRTGGGSIVNIASTAGFVGYGGLSPYTATKHAVIGLTKAVAVEAAPHNIRVNAVCPSGVATPMILNAEQSLGAEQAEKVRATLLANKPLGRYATAEEVANLCAFLLSDEASYMTGAPYLVDGGQVAQA